MIRPNTVLLIEDEAIISIIIEDILVSQGFTVTSFANGDDAWQAMLTEQTAYDLILLDRELPGADGMEILRRIKTNARFAHIPVIFETGDDDKQSIKEGLEAGAYYYLTKPIVPDLLIAVVKAALQQSLELREMLDKVRRAEQPLTFMHTGTFRFRDLEEAKLIGHFLARACPEPERAVLGLQELLINAVEHGNLGISYAEKSALVKSGNWQIEINKRLKLPEFKHKYVDVAFKRLTSEISFTITDQGIGFAWEEYQDFSADRAFDLHGRGIAMACKLSFDLVEYKGNGNCVIAMFKLNSVNSFKTDI